ncbi:MAG: hypothetical protein U1E58_10140 [Tabrizicola sp.]
MLGPSDILAQAEDQDRGRWFQLMHPVTGAPVGISLLVTGPDSRKAAEVAALMVDDLAEAADELGRVRGKDRAEIQRRALARRVLDWKAEEEGKAVPFSHAALLRLLIVGWVQAQVDTFCGARAPWFGGDNAAA